MGIKNKEYWAKAKSALPRFTKEQKNTQIQDGRKKEEISASTVRGILNKDYVWDFLINIHDLILRKSYLWAILLLAFLVRIYNLGSIGVSNVELANIEKITSLDKADNFLRVTPSTNLYYLLQNFFGKIAGYSIFNMRFLSVVISVLGLYIFFKFTEEWFSIKLAYIATFLLSISSFHILISRNISHEVLYPIIILLALHFLTLAYRYKMWQYFILSGVFFGLGFYASEISFVLLPVFAISSIYFYIKNKKFFTSFIKEKVIFLVSASVVSFPFFYSLLHNPDQFFPLFSLNVITVADNTRNLLFSLIYSSPQDYMFNIGNDRIFDPFVGITFILGLIYIALRIKRRKFYFLITWFSILTLIIIFKSSFYLGSFIYLAPIIFLMSARIQIYVLDKWFKTFPFNKFARVVMVLGIGFLFSLSLSYNFEKVFLAWMKFPERKFLYNTEPTSQKLENKKVYLYKFKYGEVTAKSIINGKNVEILTISDLKSIANDKKPNIITSINGYFEVKSNMKDVTFKEFKGNGMVLLKGE